jgi:hypothetical protein
MWLRFDATTLWHFDAAEWAPSTTSLATEPASAKPRQCPLWDAELITAFDNRFPNRFPTLI